jgi:hypothetical protein
LRIGSSCISGLLDDLAQDGDSVLGGGGLSAHAIQRLGVAGCLVGLVQVVGAGQGLGADDVGGVALVE